MGPNDRHGGTHDGRAAKARDARRAEALRANLKRRKAQVRGRAEAEAGADAPPASGGSEAERAGG